MPRVKKIEGLKIAQAFKDVGKKLEELTDDEYDILEKMVKKIKDYSKPVKFDDVSDIIFGKIPESYPPQERIMKDGTSKWSISIILQDGTWANFLTSADEKDVIEGNFGATIVVVGKIVEKDVDGTKFKNIKGYRGSLIFQGDGSATNEKDNEPSV